MRKKYWDPELSMWRDRRFFDYPFFNRPALNGAIIGTCLVIIMWAPVIIALLKR